MKVSLNNLAEALSQFPCITHKFSPDGTVLQDWHCNLFHIFLHQQAILKDFTDRTFSFQSVYGIFQPC